MITTKMKIIGDIFGIDYTKIKPYAKHEVKIGTMPRTILYLKNIIYAYASEGDVLEGIEYEKYESLESFYRGSVPDNEWDQFKIDKIDYDKSGNIDLNTMYLSRV